MWKVLICFDCSMSTSDGPAIWIEAPLLFYTCSCFPENKLLFLSSTVETTLEVIKSSPTARLCCLVEPVDWLQRVGFDSERVKLASLGIIIKDNSPNTKQRQLRAEVGQPAVVHLFDFHSLVNKSSCLSLCVSRHASSIRRRRLVCAWTLVNN